MQSSTFNIEIYCMIGLVVKYREIFQVIYNNINMPSGLLPTQQCQKSIDKTNKQKKNMERWWTKGNHLARFIQQHQFIWWAMGQISPQLHSVCQSDQHDQYLCMLFLTLLRGAASSQPLYEVSLWWPIHKAGLSLVEIYITTRIIPRITPRICLGTGTSRKVDNIQKWLFI